MQCSRRVPGVELSRCGAPTWMIAHHERQQLVTRRRRRAIASSSDLFAPPGTTYLNWPDWPYEPRVLFVIITGPDSTVPYPCM